MFIVCNVSSSFFLFWKRLDDTEKMIDPDRRVISSNQTNYPQRLRFIQPRRINNVSLTRLVRFSKQSDKRCPLAYKLFRNSARLLDAVVTGSEWPVSSRGRIDSCAFEGRTTSKYESISISRLNRPETGQDFTRDLLYSLFFSLF